MTEQEFNDLYLRENKNTKMIPTYLRDYEKFYRLMKIFSNYIQYSIDLVHSILNMLNINNAVGDVLEKIAQRLDIYIEKPINPDGTVNTTLYWQQLKIAILGNGLKRTSKADRNSLSKIIDIFTGIRRVEITDRAIQKENAIPMDIYITVVGTEDVWNRDMLEKYVLPNITGVGGVVSYLLDNDIYFGFDTENAIHIIGQIDIATESITQGALTQRANALGYTTLTLGITLTDSSGNNWVYLTTEWENRGVNVVEGETVLNPDTGYAIRGWDEGQWIDENPLD